MLEGLIVMLRVRRGRKEAEFHGTASDKLVILRRYSRL
jgi:hypothetical protein